MSVTLACSSINDVNCPLIFQMYQDVFEERFLQATDLLYSAEGQRFMGEVDVPNYLKHVDKRLKEESDRLLHYLDIGTRKPLILCVENQLISKHITNILNKGFESLMDTNSSEHLSVMYALFSRVKDGQDKLCEYFGGYVKVTKPLINSYWTKSNPKCKIIAHLVSKTHCRIFLGYLIANISFLLFQ